MMRSFPTDWTKLGPKTCCETIRATACTMLRAVTYILRRSPLASAIAQPEILHCICFCRGCLRFIRPPIIGACHDGHSYCIGNSFPPLSGKVHLKMAHMKESHEFRASHKIYSKRKKKSSMKHHSTICSPLESLSVHLTKLWLIFNNERWLLSLQVTRISATSLQT